MERYMVEVSATVDTLEKAQALMNELENLVSKLDADLWDSTITDTED